MEKIKQKDYNHET